MNDNILHNKKNDLCVCHPNLSLPSPTISMFFPTHLHGYENAG